MRVNKIRVKNFASIRDIELDLSTPGLTLVSGINADKDRSNGSGKTSIFEALIWGLFGRISKSGAKISNEVINRQTDGPAIVDISMENGDGVLGIERKRSVSGKSGKTTLKVTQDGEDVSVDLRGKDVSDSTEIIEDMIGISYDEFIRSYYFPQNAPKSFAEMTDKELKTYFLTNVLDCDWIDKCQKVAKGHVNSLTEELNRIQYTLTTLESRIDPQSQKIEGIKENLKRWNFSKIKRIEEAEQELQTLFVQGDRLKSRRKEEEDDLKNLHDQCNKWEEDERIRIGLKERDLQDLHRALEKESQENEVIDQMIAVSKEKLDAIQDLTTEQERYEDLRSAAFRLKARLDVIKEQGTKQIEVLKQIREDKESLKQQLGKECSRCGTILSQEHLPFLAKELEESIRREEAKESELNKEYEDRKQELLQQMSEIKILKEKITKNQEAEKERHETEKKIIQLENKKTYDIANQFISLKKEIEEEQTSENPYADLLKKALRKYEDNTEEEELRESIARAEKALKWQKEEDNPYEGQLEAEEKEFDDLLKSKEKEEALKVEADSQLELYNFWVDGFSSKGLQSYLLDTITPILNNALAKVLDFLTDGEMSAQFSTVTRLKSGEYRDKFGLEVVNMVGGDSYKLLSGGEAKRIDLATSMVMSDIVRNRSSNTFDLLVFDEPFKGMDQDGIDKFLEYVSEEYAGIPTFIITHTDCDKSLFNKEIIVEKREGFSEII